jgi:hypothetical protein
VTAGENLDMEWAELILEAFELGLSAEEIREFFKQTKGLNV